MKLFRFTTTTPNGRSYVDWYESDTKAEADYCHKADLERYRLPSDAAVDCVECDPVTLKPIS